MITFKRLLFLVFLQNCFAQESNSTLQVLLPESQSYYNSIDSRSEQDQRKLKGGRSGGGRSSSSSGRSSGYSSSRSSYSSSRSSSSSSYRASNGVYSYSTYRNTPTTTNSYLSNGKTYQPLYTYYRPANYYNAAGYYSTTFLLIYYNGYGYNFYYDTYAYYEYSVHPDEDTTDPVTSLIANIVCYLCCFFWIWYCCYKQGVCKPCGCDPRKGQEEEEEFEEEELSEKDNREQNYTVTTTTTQAQMIPAVSNYQMHPQYHASNQVYQQPMMPGQYAAPAPMQQQMGAMPEMPAMPAMPANPYEQQYQMQGYQQPVNITSGQPQQQ